jgi:hypothetical protein
VECLRVEPLLLEEVQGVEDHLLAAEAVRAKVET